MGIPVVRIPLHKRMCDIRYRMFVVYRIKQDICNPRFAISILLLRTHLYFCNTYWFLFIIDEWCISLLCMRSTTYFCQFTASVRYEGNIFTLSVEIALLQKYYWNDEHVPLPHSNMFLFTISTFIYLHWNDTLKPKKI